MIDTFLIYMVQRGLDRGRLPGPVLGTALRWRPEAGRTAERLLRVHTMLVEEAAAWRGGAALQPAPAGITIKGEASRRTERSGSPNRGTFGERPVQQFLSFFTFPRLVAAAVLVMLACVGWMALFFELPQHVDPPRIAVTPPAEQPVTPEPDATPPGDSPLASVTLNPAAAPALLSDMSENLTAPLEAEWALLVQDVEGGFRGVQQSVVSVIDAHDDADAATNPGAV